MDAPYLTSLRQFKRKRVLGMVRGRRMTPPDPCRNFVQTGGTRMALPRPSGYWKLPPCEPAEHGELSVVEAVCRTYNAGARRSDLGKRKFSKAIAQPREAAAMELLEAMAKAVDTIVSEPQPITILTQTAALWACAISLAAILPAWKHLQLGSRGLVTKLEAERHLRRETQAELR